MEINLVSFIYLFLRLAPFVLVSFFALSSMFNQDFKGFVYLIGLLVACFVNVMVGSFMFEPFVGTNEICNMITIGHGGAISQLPLGQAVFGYTFAYLLYAISSISNDGYSFLTQNIPTMIFFPILILFDISWNINNSCSTLLRLVVSLSLAGLVGWLWAYIIGSTNSKHLQYFVGVNNKEVCNKPSASTFKCAVYKNGTLLS